MQARWETGGGESSDLQNVMRAVSEIGVRKGGCVLETSMLKQYAAAGQPRPPPHCCFWALCWLWGEVPAELGPSGCQRVCGSPPSICFLGSLQRTSPVSYLSVARNCFSCYPVLKHHDMSDFHLSEKKVGLCFFYSRSAAVGSSGSLIPAACCSSWYLHTCRAVWYGKAQEEHLELFPALRSCCMELSARKNLRLYGYFTDLSSCAIYDTAW